VAAWLSFAGSNMAGKKGRSGRKPASARAAFIAFAEGYEADKRRASDKIVNQKAMKALGKGKE